MATKPVTTFTWATDALFGSGPAVGLATKLVPGSLPQGFIPGDGINAEWANYLENINGDWLTNWVDLGSSAGAEDAHIVETNGDGQTTLARLVAGPHSVAGSDAITATASGTAGSAIVAVGAATSGDTIDTTTVGPGDALFASVSAAGSGDAVQGQQLGTGLVAVRGVYVGLNASPGAAIFGQVSVGADDTAGVHGFASTGNFYGVKAEADLTAPSRAALWLVPQDTEPTSIEEGALFYDSTEKQLGVSNGTTWGKAWVSSSGLIEEYAESEGQTANSTLIFVTKTNVLVTTKKDNVDLWFVATGEVGGDATAVSVGVEIFDSTNAAAIKGPFAIKLFQNSGAADERFFTLQKKFTQVLASAVVYNLRFASGTDTVNSYIRLASLHVMGDFTNQS